MKAKVTILLFIGLFVFGQATVAQSNTKLDELNQLADEALQLAKFGKFEEAKQQLQKFEQFFLNDGITSKTFTMDELHVLTTTYNEALKSLNSVTLSHSERVNQLTAFRLATDAITSEYQPLWTEMEDSILSSFQNVKNAAQEGNNELYHRSLNEFLATYSVIQPSIKIDLPVEEVQKIDSKMTYIDQYRTSFSEPKWIHELEQLEEDLKEMFKNIQEDDTDPSIWWVIIMTGGIIVTTLSYVSWKKYKGQVEVKQKRKDLND